MKYPDADQELLKTLLDSRIRLANSIHDNYPFLPKEPIDENVQRVLGKLLVTRFAEDKGFIPPDSLMDSIRSWMREEEPGSLWEHLLEKWKNLDHTDNPVLPARYGVNGLIIDSLVLSEVIRELYSFSFEKITPLVLGNTYELYLGKDLDLVENTSGTKSFKLVDTVAARNSGGIYYTPSFVTKYIVKRTVEKKITAILESAKEKLESLDFDSAASTMEELFTVRVLDPACGSGAFLIEVFSSFVRAKEEYEVFLEKKLLERQKLERSALNRVNNSIKNWAERLLKKTILGLDVDRIAAEISSVSLAIVAMEKNQKLPADLNHVITVGNSLIPGPGNPPDNIFPAVSPTVNGFNWDSLGLFSFVVGNPPYVCSRREEMSSEDFHYFRERYSVASYQVDLYQIFMQLFIEVAGVGGGFIVPDPWLSNLKSEPLRKFLLANCRIDEIVICPRDTFISTVDTVVLVFSKPVVDDYTVNISRLERNGEEPIFLYDIPVSRFKSNPGNVFDILVSPSSRLIIDKIEEKAIPLGTVNPDLAARGVGVYHKRKHSQEAIIRKIYHADHKRDETYIPYIKGNLVKWYGLAWDGKTYLSYGDWLAEPRVPELFDGPRILIRKVPRETFYCCFVRDKLVADQSVYIWKPEACQIYLDPFYVLGWLNSDLLSYYFRLEFNQMGVFPQIRVEEFRNLPVKLLEQLKMNEVADYSRLLSFFTQLITSSADEI
ncbi:MAG: Eco57I restriction-modification methylase domain-containing protein, partial [Candidatus Odinarchaeota archaeon]